VGYPVAVLPVYKKGNVMNHTMDMQPADKLQESFNRALPLLPADVANELKSLMTPEALATMATFLVVWAGSHFFGIGEIADIVLLIVGVVALGGVAWKAGKDMVVFINKSLNAKTDSDFDIAAKHFASAVSLIGIQTVMMVLLKKRPKCFKTSFLTPGRPFFKFKQMPRGPRNAAGPFYKTNIKRSKRLSPGEGETSMWGDIVVSSSGPLDEKKLCLFHELTHRFLTPKLYVLREFRIYPSTRGYSYSYLLRYLEEALAETVAQISVKGIKLSTIKTAIKFPVENGYVTIAGMKTEGIGILLGPINAGGMIFKAYFTYTAQRFEND
jgi:hypothetical protein